MTFVVLWLRVFFAVRWLVIIFSPLRLLRLILCSVTFATFWFILSIILLPISRRFPPICLWLFIFMHRECISIRLLRDTSLCVRVSIRHVVITVIIFPPTRGGIAL